MAITESKHPKEIFPFQLIRPALDRVEIAIRDQVRAFDPGIEPYMAYICNTSGKRIRPALAALVGGAAGVVNDDHVKIGVILELIHMATLVHDDIIDGADTRRKMPTANAKWGNGLSVLLGDALFAHALTLATDFDSVEICKMVGNASREVCQGEIVQTQRRFDLTLTKDEYFRIIGMKTGALFAAATGISAKLSGMGDDACAKLSSYGMKLGTVYQIYDDCLDIVGTEKEAGKTLRTDLVKGKLTLPILYLLETASDSQRMKISKRILDQEPLDLSVLLGIAEYAGAIEASVDTAQEMLKDCRADLAVLADSEYRDAMVQITQFLHDLLETCRR